MKTVLPPSLRKQLPSVLLVLASLSHAQAQEAQDALWQQLASGERLVMLLRHAEARGGQPTHFDASGQCQGESLLHEAPAGGLTVFVSHAPNLFELALEELPLGTGLVGQVDDSGTFNPLGQVKLY